MRLLLATLFCLTVLSPAFTPSRAQESCGLTPELQSELKAVWQLAYPHLQSLTETGLAEGNPNALYQLAQYTHPFIGAARDCQMRSELDELCALYLRPFGRVQHATRGGEQFDAWLCSGPACPSWTEGAEPFEVILYSAQFLYAACTLINTVTTVPESERTAVMNKLLKQAPYIAETYERWLSSSGDALFPRGVRHATAEAINTSHRTDDKQLQIAGGIVEMLGAAGKTPGALGLGADTVSTLRDYASLYWNLIESRATFDANGRVTYDEAWGTIPRARCASHTKKSAPRPDQCTGSRRLSLDLAHFARVPMVIESYDRCGFADGERYLKGLAMQLADRVWNGDIRQPRFFNYFSGAGMYGWYGRTFDAGGKVRAKGWAPLSLSNKGPLYFQLGRYSPRVRNISAAYLKANRNSLRAGRSSDTERVFYVLSVLPNFISAP